VFIEERPEMKVYSRLAEAMPETEAAPYTVLKKWDEENVELRQYPAQKWVSTKSISSSIDEISSSSFWKLFNYIRGKNAANKKIPMTKPVCFTSNPNEENVRTRHMTASFYIPSHEQGSPPEPQDPSVFIEERPEMKVYSRSYSGFSNNNKLNEQAKNLAASLEKIGLKYRKDPYYFAGYDSPFRLLNRHNEVWFPATE
jgi:hypothetical protein